MVNNFLEVKQIEAYHTNQSLFVDDPLRVSSKHLFLDLKTSTFYHSTDIGFISQLSNLKDPVDN